MSTAVEIRREGEIHYSKPIARALLRDARLSFGARGLFSFLWDLPTGWRTNSEHLASMSPQGRDAIRTLLRELENVGAMRSEAIRNERGRMAGKRWVLVSPEKWANESPLSIRKPSDDVASAKDPTEERVFRPSGKPKIEKSNTKVSQGKGFSSLSTTETRVAVEIDELVDAAVWAYSRGGGKISNEAGFRHAVRTRILSNPQGPTTEDTQTLTAWRAARAAEFARDSMQQAERDQKLSEKALAAVALDEEEKTGGFLALLDSSSRDLLLREFSEHLLSKNPFIHKFFLKSGTRTKIASQELIKFVATTKLRKPPEAGL